MPYFEDEDLPLRYGPLPKADPPAVFHVPMDGWKWLARIRGTHPEYRYDREFMQKDGGYRLSAGFYEGCHWDKTREFLSLNNDGKLRRVDQEDLDRELGIIRW
jgi:hypothetical protein